MSETDWVAAAFGAWLGWKVLPALLGIGLLCAFAAVLWAPRALKRARCKHERYHETSACDAVCSDCGKNLGFIGNVRSATPK